MLTSTLALLAVACQKTEIINPMENQQGLTFTTEFGKLTKASGADGGGMENLQAQDFRIWAYAAHDFDNTAENDANQIYDHIENVKVFDYTVSAETIGWKAEKQYFWPGADKNLYFFAVSDDPIFLGTEGQTSTNVNIKLVRAEGDAETVKVPALTVSNYVVDPTNPNNDLMVANFIKQNQDQSDKKVNLMFNHTLSKIQFRFKTNEIPEGKEPIAVFVQKLEVGESVTTDGATTVVGGLKNKGVLSATVKETTTGTTTTAEVSTLDLKWTLDNNLAVFTDRYTDEPADFPTKIEGVDIANITGVDKSAMKLTTVAEGVPFATWLVLPQDVKGKKVKVTYLINGRQFANEFALDAFTDSDDDEETCMWAVNQYVKYTINLSPNLITFDAKVENWNPVEGTNVNHAN